jgi:hypothetical protein
MGLLRRSAPRNDKLLIAFVLDVWQQSMKVAQGIYKLTNALPADEKFGLVSQMRP